MNGCYSGSFVVAAGDIVFSGTFLERRDKAEGDMKNRDKD